MYKILIRPLEQNDSEISWKWRNDEEVWKYTGSRPNISVTPEIERDWINKVLNQTNSRRFAITVDDKYVGNIQLTNITSENAEYHIFIGDKDYWGKGIGFSATQQIIRFAKNVLKLKQVYLYVQKDNENAVKLYQRCGFVQVSNDIKMILDLNYTNPPQVSVFCMVYNHEPFLEQCLEGFLMQKCLFDFEIVIGEDCSKDKSREILLKYQSKFPGKFKLLLHNQNVGAVNNQNIVLSNCTGKYIALCEGDDYWTDPLKLQKQFDFLEENEEYGLVHSQLKYKFGNSKESIVSKTDRKKNKFEDLIKHNSIATLTTCIRQKLVMNYLEQVNPINKNWVAGDLPMWLWISLHSKIYFLDEVTSMYRVVAGSASNTKTSEKYLEFIKSRRSIKEYFINNYQPNDDLLQFVVEDFYKDAEFHVLKLRDKAIINEIGNYFYSKDKKIILAYYLIMMDKLFNYPLLYKFCFNVYRVYYRFIKKHKKYEQ
jgi:RimJ/RimL family protein N-acetyltransferase/glycosyltransferase involved in cell wall biosynthesis